MSTFRKWIVAFLGGMAPAWVAYVMKDPKMPATPDQWWMFVAIVFIGGGIGAAAKGVNMAGDAVSASAEKRRSGTG